jgi:membrane associated rhomboid family serine protease
MFPLRDVIPSRTTPWVTYSLVAANIVAWAVGPAHSWVLVAGNTVALWVFGDNVEDRCGHARFLLLYVVCGGAAVIAQAMVTQDWTSMALTASAVNGAAAGVIGAYFTLFPKSLVLMGVYLVVFVDVIEVPAVAIAGVWVVMQIIIATMMLWALLGAALVGALGVWLLKRPERLRVDWWNGPA